MNLSRLFILRPVATSLTMLALLLCGALAYRFLPVASLPQIDYPTVQVNTLYPRCESRGDDRNRHCTIGATARANAGLGPNDLGQLRRARPSSLCVFR
jgi:hypothetical protein